MVVNSVNSSDAARVEQVKVERRAEDVKRQEETDRTTQETRRAAEAGRGGNMDVTA
jgi:hypothetical protein